MILDLVGNRFRTDKILSYYKILLKGQPLKLDYFLNRRRKQDKQWPFGIYSLYSESHAMVGNTKSQDKEMCEHRSRFCRLHFSPLFGPSCGRQIIFQNY